MKQIQILQITPEELQTAIIEGVKTELEGLKKYFQPKDPPKYITRQFIADEIIHCDISTVHNLTVKGILTKYQIGGRVLYIRDEVEAAIVKLNK